jgi:hypothetical protein
MNKNAIYNVIICLCLASGLYNLSACVFNPMGVTIGNITTEEVITTTNISTSIISTSEINETSSTGSTNPTTSLNTSIDFTTTNEVLTTDTTEFTGSTIDISTSEDSTSTTIQSICGNNILELGEYCDGPDLGNNKCEHFGLPENGMLFCNRDCTFNTTKCGNCGNCILDAGEECDPCLFEITEGAYCESEETDFGKCILKFTKPMLYSWHFISNGQMVTSALDKEEADILCKIYHRNLNSVATSWDKTITGWPKNYNYFHHFTLGLDPNEAIPLISTKEILYDYNLYYIDSKYLSPNLDPAATKFRFSCELP